MSVIGIILGSLLLGLLVYLIVRNVIGIVQNIKARRQAKKNRPDVSAVIDSEDYEKKEWLIMDIQKDVDFLFTSSLANSDVDNFRCFAVIVDLLLGKE